MDKDSTHFCLVFTVTDQVHNLINALEPLKELHIPLKHLETRPSKTASSHDVFLECPCSNEVLPLLVGKIRAVVGPINIFQTKELLLGVHVEGHCTPWFPKSIQDLDISCNNVIKYGDQLTPDHAGYGDPVYRERRRYIASIANNYRQGEPIPRLEYTKEELDTWKVIFNHQSSLYPAHACKEYNEQFPALFSECNYREDNIPQAEDVSQYLKACTGYQLRPVAGWIHSRDFLAALAFRVFPTTQYIRHDSKPKYTPEPDICHELMGHVPLFANASFAQFSQEIGLASLGASDEWIEKLSSLYWFTIEFGLCMENGQPKAYGAGLLSSCEELTFCVSDQAKYEEFDCTRAVLQSYPTSGLQPLYFVAKSFDDMTQKLREFAKKIPKPFTVSYDPATQGIQVVDTPCGGHCRD